MVAIAVKVTRKGQITLPAEIRRAFGIEERVLGVPRPSIAPALWEIVSLPAIDFDHRQTLLHAIDLWEQHGPLSLPDAYHLVFAKDVGLDKIYTYDKKTNRYSGIERIKP